MEEKAKKVLQRLEASCAKREYCRSEVMDKALKALEGDRSAALEIVESLVRDKYVDDLRYASAYAREKASISGWGPVKIRFMLSGKGISKETADAALEEIDPERAGSRMDKVLAAKWKTLEGDPQARLKLLKFALSRGYEYDDVRDAVDRICRG